jgi:transcriptional regulator with XRE-family HTH domain
MGNKGQSSGDIFKAYRASLALTQDQLAFILGIDVRTVREYEAGRVRSSRYHLLAMAYLLDNKHQLASIIDLEDNELFPGLHEPCHQCPTCQQYVTAVQAKRIRKDRKRKKRRRPSHGHYK